MNMWVRLTYGRRKIENEEWEGKAMTDYAHSLENQPVTTWQPLVAHLLAVAVLAREFAQGFGLTHI